AGAVAAAGELRVAAAAARRIRGGRVGVIGAEGERVIDRHLGGRQVRARRQRAERLAALGVARLADAHAEERRHARAVVVAGDAGGGCRWRGAGGGWRARAWPGAGRAEAGGTRP